jgi:zinc protease
VFRIHEEVKVNEPGLLPYPDFTDTRLPNGLRVLIAEHHDQPAVFSQMLVRAGIRDEALGKEGLAEIVAAMLDQGTTTRTAGQISSEIDRVGGHIRASAEYDYTTVECGVLAEDRAVGLDLFADVIRNPVFARRDLERVKRQLRAAQAQVRTEPSALAQIHSRNLMFGSGIRLGREKTPGSIGHTTSNEVREFHQRYYHPGDAILLVIGDFNRAKMLDEITRRFESWAPGSTPSRPRFQPEPMKEKRLRLVNKPGQTQGQFCLAEWGIESHSPDRPAFQIMDYILGGGAFSSRLMTAIRVEQGKTYGINSSVELHPDYGLWRVRTFTRNEEVAGMYRSVRSELAKFIADGITEEERQRAQDYYRGALPLGLDSPRDIGHDILDGLDDGFTLDEMRREVIELQAVTREDVNRVARKYLSADAFGLVIVGDARQLRGPLAEIGKFEEKDFRKTGNG